MNGDESVPPPGPRKLAILCFIPEVGHLAPLLRIGRRAQDSGFEVKAFVADEARPMVERFGVPAAYIGPTKPPGTEGLMRELARVADTFRHASAARRFENEYWVPLILSLAEGLEGYRERIADFGPDLVLEDSHVIGWIYRDVAPSVPHVVHVAAGSHFHCQEPGALEGHYWRRLRSRWRDRRFKALYKGWLKVGRVTRQESWVKDRILRGQLEEAKASAAARAGPVVERKISSGMGVFEEEMLAPRIKLCEEVEFFGTVDPNSRDSPDPGLISWLGSSDRPVALVSFGSMIPSDTQVGGAVRKGLEGAGVRVLWVSGEKEGSGDAGGSTKGQDWFRREGFVPQADILAHPAVKVFVTHGGSGGVQDGVWNGIPLLCVPMVSDQPYNARVVEALGGGLTLPAREISATKARAAVSRILQDQAFAQGAEELSRKMREKEGGKRVVELLAEVADTR